MRSIWRRWTAATLYVGLFGNEYGFEDEAGVSPTEREFDRATAGEAAPDLREGRERPRTASEDGGARAKSRRRSSSAAGSPRARAHCGAVRESRRASRSTPVHDSHPALRRGGCPEATPGRSRSRQAGLLPRACAGEAAVTRWRRDTPIETALAHLNLLDGGRRATPPSCCSAGARSGFCRRSEVKCLHFHGTEVASRSPRTRSTRARFSSWWIRPWTS